MNVYCVTLDGILYDVYDTRQGADARRAELQKRWEPGYGDKYRVEAWEVKSWLEHWY